MDEIKSKQQVVEKIKGASKILVTVSDNPSVDALSAALGLAMLLDKQEKYATAIFSGETPPAIAFLEPEKTFDDTTDSLRDFIIALNKEKADHLRYKVEDDSVKIFITPYKTTITDADLEFSQGDYNVELVIALGVDKQEHLDGALESHGQILHDADIITVTAGDQTSDLGGVDWHDSQASSLSEMVTGLAEALKEDKKKTLIDSSIATALLTGIVAETDRFSNEHTTSKVMTVAASLMAAGADQQLIANELRQAHEIDGPISTDSDDDSDDAESDDDVSSAVGKDGSISVRGGKGGRANKSASKAADDTLDTKANAEPAAKKDGLSIKHDSETLADLDRRVRGDEKAKEKIEEEIEALEQDAESKAKKYPLVSDAVAEKPKASTAYAMEDEASEPLLGGTLNATSEQAAEDARSTADADKNKTILSHSYLGESPVAPATGGEASNSDGLVGQGSLVGFPGTPEVAPGSLGVNEVPAPGDLHLAYALDGPETNEPGAPSSPTTETVSSIEPIGGERVIQPLHNTIQAPADLGLPLPPPIPDFAALGATPPPAIPLPPIQQPEILGDILAPETNAVQPQPEVPQQSTPAADPPLAPGDPGQFKIPGQS